MGTVFQGDVQTEPGPGHRVTRHCGRGSLAWCRMKWTSLCSSKRLAPIKSRHAQVAATQCGLPERDHQTANCQPCRHSNVGHAAFRFQPKLSSKSAENGAPHASSRARQPDIRNAGEDPPLFGGMAPAMVERVVSRGPMWGQHCSFALALAGAGAFFGPGTRAATGVAGMILNLQNLPRNEAVRSIAPAGSIPWPHPAPHPPNEMGRCNFVLASTRAADQRRQSASRTRAHARLVIFSAERFSLACV